jgi:hypothetical protein
LLQIRDSQAQASTLNQNKPTPYNNGLPLNPNSINTINVDFNMLNNPGSPSYTLPNRQRQEPTGPASLGRVTSISDSLSPSGSENAPSPANERGSSRSNSAKDTSSHTSFTPPSTTTDSSDGAHRRSNIGNTTSPRNATTGQTSGPFGTFYTNPMDNEFSNFQPAFFSQPIGESPGFGMGGWDMSGVEMTTGTGMTPLPSGMTPMTTDTEWNRIMEDMDRFASNNAGASGNG